MGLHVKHPSEELFGMKGMNRYRVLLLYDIHCLIESSRQ